MFLPRADQERLGEPIEILDVAVQVPALRAGATPPAPKLSRHVEERVGVARRERIFDGHEHRPFERVAVEDL